MNEQQRINLALMRELAALGVEFAFPTRTLYVTQAGTPATQERSRAAPPSGAVPATAQNG
jgi:hypothetical protein